VAKVLGLVAATLLGAATYLTGQLLGDADRQTWIKARAVAEGLKSESYKFATGAPPYEGPDASAQLAAKVQEAQALLPGVVAESIPDTARLEGMPAGHWTLDDYLKKRFEDQRRYYEGAVAKHKRTVRTARNLSMGLGLIAVVLSASSSTIGQQWPAALLGIVTTAGASIAAWFQGGHHQQLALMYQATLVKLGLLEARLQPGMAFDPRFVFGAEAIFQEEHAAWLGEWQSPAIPSSAPVPSIGPPVGPVATT
jgi:hypothetical protein